MRDIGLIKVSEFRITLTGLSATGTSSTAKEILRRLGPGIPYFNAGGIMRDMARERGMAFHAFLDYIKDKPEIDEEIDATMERAGRMHESAVFEGRVVTKKVHDGFNIHVGCAREKRGERRYQEHLEKKPEHVEGKTPMDILIEEEARDAADIVRLEALYGKLWTPEMFHCRADTTIMTTPEVVEQILDEYIEWVEGGRIPGPLTGNEVITHAFA